jgi:hypothetical protein
MPREVLAVLLVLLIIYVVPFVVYGVASVLGGPKPPDTASPARFLGGVFVTKLGTAIAFVALFALARGVWQGQWLLYGLIWLVMFALSEVGEAISGRTSVPEAVLGIVSECLYAPLSALAVSRLLR